MFCQNQLYHNKLIYLYLIYKYFNKQDNFEPDNKTKYDKLYEYNPINNEQKVEDILNYYQ